MTNEETKELIELAARAMQQIGDPNFANFDVLDDCICLQLGCRRGAITAYWNPHISGTDSRSLQVALDIAVIPYPIYGMPKHSVIAKQYQSGDMMREQNPTEVIERFCDHPNKEAAYCMAVLRCAAEIQRRKEDE